MPLDATNFFGEPDQDFVVIPDDDQHAPAALLPALPVQEKFTKEEEDAVRVLRYALQLIERGWTRKAYARFLFIPLPTESRMATHYCARGALYRASSDLGLSTCLAEDMLNGIPGVNGNLIDFNDKHTKADVVFAFQCAIAENT